MKILERREKSNILKSLSYYPAVALLGPRQAGKTTLAKQLGAGQDWVYLDLERPSDLAKLDDAESYLQMHKNKLVCLDEVQRRPDIFSLLRSLIDEDRRPGRFLLLGSASIELLQQSSESLAGRIAYHQVLPFNWTEIQQVPSSSHQELFQKALQRGGFPDSFLAPTDDLSWNWREQFIQTFLERDLALLQVRTPAMQMRRLWLMCAHFHGQIVNYSKIAGSLDVTHPTVKSYIDTLVATFMIQLISPWEVNIKKRLVKSPKIYLRDPGILASLLGLQTFESIFSHPSYGAFWEGYALENIVQHLGIREPAFGFYRTHTGEEIDLVCKHKGKTLGFEFKTGSQPKLADHTRNTLDEIKIDEFYVVVPERETYPILSGRGKVISLDNLLKEI
jgi:predicted AAA+ superfamily ATPase